MRAERAWALYSFSNTSGRPLPEGRVTVSEGGTVVGTGYAAWTPPGEAALVAVSSVQGVTVRRSEEATPQPKTWETQRTVKLRVENGRAAELAVRVVEHRLERWELAYYEAFASRADAMRRERRLKHDGRARRQLMVRIAGSLAGLSRGRR